MLASLGHPCNFQRVSRLGSVTARHSSSARQPNFAALNRGRHLYLAGRPSRWALAHIVVQYEMEEKSTILAHWAQKVGGPNRLRRQCPIAYTNHNQSINQSINLFVN